MLKLCVHRHANEGIISFVSVVISGVFSLLEMSSVTDMRLASPLLKSMDLKQPCVNCLQRNTLARQCFAEKNVKGPPGYTVWFTSNLACSNFTEV